MTDQIIELTTETLNKMDRHISSLRDLYPEFIDSPEEISLWNIRQSVNNLLDSLYFLTDEGRVEFIILQKDDPTAPLSFHSRIMAAMKSEMIKETKRMVSEFCLRLMVDLDKGQLTANADTYPKINGVIYQNHI